MQFAKIFTRLISVAILVYSYASTAATISLAESKNGNFLDGVLIEGVVEKGDSLKFAALALSGPGVRAVYLASPGGDLAESMKIGRLVRALYLEAWAPFATESSLLKLGDKKNNTCASSCFYIYVAGVKRIGSVLGVHRPYLPPEKYREVALPEAASAHANARKVVEKYFQEMGVPSSYVDKVMAVPSEKVEWLSERQVRADLEGFPAEIAEWMSANCKKLTPEDERRMNQILASIPKNRMHLPVSEAPSKAADREFVSTYHRRMRGESVCYEKAFEAERERVRPGLVKKFIAKESE